MADDSQQRGTRTQAVASPRRRFQFSLKGLLLFTAYLAVLLSIVASIVAWRPHRASAWIEFRVPYHSMLIPPPELVRTVFEVDVRAPILSSEVLAGAASRPEIATLSVFPRQQSRTDWLAEHIEVERVHDSELVTVSLTARDPDDAAKIVNAVVDSYFQSRTWRSPEAMRLRRQLEALEDERERRSAELEELREDVREMAQRVSTDRHLTPFLPECVTGMFTSDDVVESLARHEAERATLEARLAALGPEIEGTVEADVVQPPHEQAAAIQREIDACRTVESWLRRRCREQIEGAVEDDGELLELELARAEVVRAMCVFQIVRTRIMSLRTDGLIQERGTLLQKAAPPAPRVAIPYKTITAISAVWLAVPLLLGALCRAMRRRQVKS
ncbi:MAG TPA: hypothetical protein VMY37_03910 [Thermoguttaceae bacterium]|nr:hypothetical protein [Thermoguttaceae bacterium]